MPAIGGAVCVSKYLKTEPNACDFPVGEFREFWQSCSVEDKADFTAYATNKLGLTKNEEGKYE